MRAHTLFKKRKPTQTTMEPIIVQPVLAPTLLEDEDDFFLPADDDPGAEDKKENFPEEEDIRPVLHDSSTMLKSSSVSVSLEPIEEQPNRADTAVAILENFFYGGNQVRQKPLLGDAQKENYTGRIPSTTVQPASSRQFSDCRHATGEVESSPTSVVMPVCSCPAERNSLFAGLHNANSTNTSTKTKGFSSERSNSMPAISRSSSCSPKPKKPTLKQRISSSSSLSSSKRNVSFTEISVREYDVELSDHPSCSFGPPIQLGWEYEEKEKVPVEDYEVTRSPRREVHELVLSYNARRRRLKQSGYKKKEIQAVEKEVDRIKRERLVTELFLPASAIDETFERVFVGLKRMFQRKHVCELHP